MKILRIQVHIVLLPLILWSNSVYADSKGLCDVNQDPLSKVILSFSSRLMQEIGGEKNVFFSPLSISAALAMIYMGTEGTTKTQMTNVMQYYMFGDECLKHELSKQFKTVMDSLDSSNDVISLLIANGVFIHLDYTVSEDYTSRLQEYFKSDVNYLDFTNEGKLSLEAINEWISHHTRGMVPKLLNEPLDPLTVMVLINAIYFKGLWEHPFSENNTFNGFFYVNRSTRKIVPFMQLEASLNYFFDSESNNHFLEMNYEGGNVSMLLVLPKNVRDFPELELTSKMLCMIKSQLQQQDIKLIFPKFRLEYKRELSKDMTNLGLSELFSDKADLSGIRKDNDLHVSLMLHKAIIVVDEHGSEASAVSGIGIDVRRKQSDVITLWVNHPFLFYIINKEMDIILFAGRVSDPE